MPDIMNGAGNHNGAKAFRILVVDDEPLLCKMVSAMLKREGYTIRTVTNGKDALAAVEEEQPDLITLDVMMPDISGIEVAKKLRSKSETASIPIIFVTALDRSVSAELRRLTEEPHTYHMDKPFSRDQLVLQVSIALQAAYGEHVL